MGMSALPHNLAWIATAFPDLTHLAQLGVGGQKLVLSAQHATDGDVVLKLFTPTTDAQTVTREILAVSSIASPLVPAILDQGTTASPLGTLHWLRERHIRGETLRAHLDRGARLDAIEVVKFCGDLLQSLAAAEAVQIVHRDVKPDNVILDPAGRFWLLDFGLARHLLLTSMTASAAPFGKMTPGYAPPEQFKNYKRQIDGRADLFATGVTAIEMATGVNHFRDGAADTLTILGRVESMASPPLTLSLTHQNEFRDFIAALTQRRREHRPPSVTDAYAWLQDIRQREGI
jgi:serine/threonine protein kinase